MKKIIFILFITIVGCVNINKVERPESFLDIEKMSDVFADLYLIEGAIGTNRDNFMKTGTLPTDYIYKKHQIDSLVFKENLEYYNQRPDEYMEMIELTQSKLNTIKDSIAARQQRENKLGELKTPLNTLLERDSINNLKEEN